MSFKGTDKSSALELTLAIESGGGQANAGTSEDHTSYEAQGEAALMPGLIETLAEMVWHSNFPEAEISIERDVIGEEITMVRESPSDYITDLLASALWPNHPLGAPILGTSESVDKITRSDLQKFAEEYHFSTDMLVATAGPMPIAEIESYLAPLLPKSFKQEKKPQPYQSSPSVNVHLEESTDQLQFAIGWHTPGRDSPKRYPLRLLSLILGESSSSRLFVKLREELGLCYQISSELSLFAETGALQVISGLDPSAEAEARKIIDRETADLAKYGPTDEELTRAKRLAISQMKLASESTAAHAAWAGESLLFYQQVTNPSSVREQLLAVTAEQIRGIAQQIFSSPPGVAKISA